MKCEATTRWRESRKRKNFQVGSATTVVTNDEKLKRLVMKLASLIDESVVGASQLQVKNVEFEHDG